MTSPVNGSPESPVIWRNRLGREMRHLRETRGLRLEDVARKLDLAPSTLSRLERGHAPVKTSYLAVIFQLYDLSDPAERNRLMEMARKGQNHGWWRRYNELLGSEACRYLGLEAAATGLQAFSLLTVPGLLQTEDYAAAALTATRPELPARDIRDLVDVQTRRQEALRRSGCQLDLLIDESALLRTIGSTRVMIRQIERLAEAAAQPNVTVRQVSLHAIHPALAFPYTILTFADPGDNAVVCHHGGDSQITLTADEARVQAARKLHDVMAKGAVPHPEHAEAH